MKKGQIFGIATYDAMFKWVLSSDSIRSSFFHAFIPNITVQFSERLDDHMNPLQELQLLRDMVNDTETTNLVESLKNNDHHVEVHIAHSYHERATQFLQQILHHFDDIQYSFPKPLFNGTMDFVCRLDTEEYALVEMQIIPEDKWDQRALAYVASFYGSQLRKKADWKEIRRVIGVNILGGGKHQEKHWKETPNQYVRYYKFQEQLHREIPPRILEGIDIIQYSLANAPKNVNSQEQTDWLRFLKEAHTMTEDDVQKEIKTPAVVEAFERAKLVTLPEAVRSSYEKQDILYENLSGYIAEKRAEGEARGRAEGEAIGEARGRAEGEAIGEAKGRAEGEMKKAIEMAKRMIKKGRPLEEVCEITELSLHVVQGLVEHP